MGSYINICLSLHKYVLKINKSDCREGALSGMGTEEGMKFAHRSPLYKRCVITPQTLKFKTPDSTQASCMGVGDGQGASF